MMLTLGSSDWNVGSGPPKVLPVEDGRSLTVFGCHSCYREVTRRLGLDGLRDKGYLQNPTWDAHDSLARTVVALMVNFLELVRRRWCLVLQPTIASRDVVVC
jgi:hypothetical protein